MNDNCILNLNYKEEEQENQIPKKKRRLSQIEKDIIKLNYLSNLKIIKNYNCSKKKYEKYIINNLLNNANCHLVSIFKERMLTDFVDEFLRREYAKAESADRIPKFALYYKNYLKFFCQPTFSNFVINNIISDYGERKAEVYYKNNYQGGKSKENEDLGFEESDSEEETEKDIRFKYNENGEIFNDSIKENIDNVTVMTTISNSKNNTINLNLNNEKIEVFSENKCDKSNDTTLHEVIDIVKKGKQNINTKKAKASNINLNNDKDNDINNNIDNNYSSSNYNSTNINNTKSKKGNKVSKKKNNFMNIIDYKKSVLNKGLRVQSHNKKKEASKSHKKGNKTKKKFSIDKLQKLFIKGRTYFKYLNFKKNKFPRNIFNNPEKVITNSNLNLNKDSYNKNKNKKLSNHSVNLILKNKSISKEKEQDKKSVKNINKTNKLFSIKNSSGNINNNLMKNNFNKNNIYNFNYGNNKNLNKSRNNTGFLYKLQNNTNNIINNNIIYNLNNIYNTTSLHKLYKNINNNIHNNGYFGKINVFKTLNFIQTTNHLQKYNNNFVSNQNENKGHISYTSQDNKSSSLKILVTDLNNQNHIKPTIKLQNEKDLIKSKYNRESNIFDLNSNKNHRITKSCNNLNLNNIISTNNCIGSYNNYKYKNKKFNNNAKATHQLKNIKSNQINSNSSNKKKAETNNKELIKLALSLLIDNNATFNNVMGNNGVNTHNNNTGLKKIFISRNSNKKNSVKKSKTNINNYKKYHNTNYNININNQININTNSNNGINNLKNGKDYLNKKLKNKEMNNNSKLKDLYGNNIYNNSSNSNLHLSNCHVNNINTNHNSENIYMNKKKRTRNIKSGFKKININNKNNKNEDNIIKSYHTKSVSSLTDLINHNKKLMGLYRNASKSKSKEH